MAGQIALGVLVAIGFVALIGSRSLRPRRINERKVFSGAIVIFAIGAVMLHSATHVDWNLVAAGVIVVLALGAWIGVTYSVSVETESDGSRVAVAKGNWKTLTLTFTVLAVRLGFDALEMATGHGAEFLPSFLMMIGAALLAMNVVVAFRAGIIGGGHSHELRADRRGKAVDAPPVFVGAPEALNPIER